MPDIRHLAWEEIRHAYVATPEPLRNLCNRFGITPLDLTRARKAHGWPPRPSPIKPSRANPNAIKLRRSQTAVTSKSKGQAKQPRPAKRPRKKPARKSKSVKKPLPAAPSRLRKAQSRQAVTRRLLTIIAKKLERMEQQIGDATLPSIADSEREARALGVMIANVERLKGLDGDDRSSSAAASSFGTSHDLSDPHHQSDPSGAAHELERLRNDLAQRLDRLSLTIEATEVPVEPDA